MYGHAQFDNTCLVSGPRCREEMEDDSASDLGMNNMTKIETFWGKTLSSKNRVYDWTGEDEAEEGIQSTVELRGACLGVSDSLKPKERNVVAITTENEDGEEETFVIASLRLEGVEQVPLLHQVEPPVKFELLKGSGPVHITGLMVSGFAEGDDDEDDEDDEEEEEEEEEQTVQTSKPGNKAQQEKGASNKMKRPAGASSQPKPAKVAKMEREEEEDEEIDESMEGDDSMNNEEVDSGDEDDDSDDDLDDEEEEEEQVAPPKKKAPMKGGSAVKKPVVSRTPQPTKVTKPPVKTPLSTQKPGKTATPNKTPLSIDQIKKKLIQTGNFPKKLDKFNNYMTNTFKISDDNTKKELWEFAQKNRK